MRAISKTLLRDATAEGLEQLRRPVEGAQTSIRELERNASTRTRCGVTHYERCLNYDEQAVSEMWSSKNRI